MYQHFLQKERNACPARQVMLMGNQGFVFDESKSFRQNSAFVWENDPTDIESFVAYAESVFKRKEKTFRFRILHALNEVDFKISHFLKQKNYEHVRCPIYFQQAKLEEDSFLSSCVFANLKISFLTDPMDTRWHHVLSLLNKNERNGFLYMESLKLVIPEQIFLVASIHERIIGFARAVMEQQDVGIYDVVVDSTMRNKGIGTNLVQRLMQESLKKGCKSAYLQVLSENGNAIRVYEKLGFKNIFGYYFLEKV